MKTSGTLKDVVKDEESNLIQYAGLVVPGLFVIVIMAVVLTLTDKK